MVAALHCLALGFAASPVKDKVPDAYGSKPHLVFALIDDMGWSDTEFGGSGTADFGRTKTPVMKSLEKDSVHLNRQYAYSWCGPSRSSLLSGRLPVHVNVNHSVPTAFIASDPDSSGEGIPAGMTTIGSKLQTAGYRTHYVGKWGVGWTWKGQNPIERGFNSFFGYLHDSIDFWDEKLGYQSIEVPGGCEKVTGNGNPKDIKPGKYTWWEGQPLATDLCRVVDGSQVAATSEQGKGWVDYQFLDESKKIIDGHKSYHSDKPLFLFHSFHSIHAPLNAPEELYTGDYAPAPCGAPDSIMPDVEMKDCFMEHPGPSRNSFAAMVTWTDKAIGEIIDKLKAYDMWKTTLLVSSADNGGAQYFSQIGYQLWGSGNNLPFRGGKASEWEGGIRVNSFVTGGLLAGSPMLGKSSDSLMQFADWYGTFCYLAGIPQTDEMAISKSLPDVDSINQWPAFWSDAKPRDEIHVSPVTLIAGNGKWKILTGPDPGSINSHTRPGFVPFSDYGVGYYNGHAVGSGNRAGPPDQPGLAAKGGFYSTWAITCESSVIDDLSNQYGLSIECPGVGMDCREGCLFDLDNDPEELYDVADKHPEVLATMKEKLQAYSKKWDPANPSQGSSYTNQGIFNPIRNGATKDCRPVVGKDAAICGSDYCSDSEWAYDPSCYPNCMVCPPQEAGCVDSVKDDPMNEAKKISLKGCSSIETCHKFTHETGFYSWVAPSAGP